MSLHRLNDCSRPPAFCRRQKKAGGQEIGRSRGGLTTKLHVAVDALGNPLRVILSAGQLSDIDYAAQLIDHLPTQAVIADKGYDANHFVTKIEAMGAQAVIPPRSNRLTPRQFDRDLYQARNQVERKRATPPPCQVNYCVATVLSGNSSSIRL